VEQQLLTFEGLYEWDIQQVISQKPALDQLRAFKPNHSWAEFFVSDTVLAAARVAKHKGRIGGVPTAAVASRQAGEGINGLKSLGRVSPPGNATTFWFFTRPGLSDERHFGNPTHASFTFVITDEQGSLYRVANEIVNYGFSMDDIDSHLARAGDSISFYAEVKFENGENDARFESLIKKLRNTGHSPQTLGKYVDRTSKKTRAYIKQAERVYPDVATLAWSEHANNFVSEGAQVFYVRGDDRIGLLRDILAKPDHLGISIAQMSRPLNAGRGFMLIFDRNVKTEGLEGIFHQEGFIVRQMTYKNGKLV
jgi:prephenate dehydratase